MIGSKVIVGSYGGKFEILPMNSKLISDLNGDGYVDYVFTTTNIGSSIGNPVKLFLSSSNGQLTDQSTQIQAGFTSLWTQKIIAADFNNDGRIDILLGAAPEQGNTNRSNNSNFLNWGSPQYVLMQNADGTFTPNQISSDIFEAHYSGIGDFNGDGYQDIILISDIDGGSQLPRLYMNQKNGTFKLADLSSIVGTGSAAQNFHSFYGATGDFNGDGNLDIAFLAGGVSNGAYDFIAYSDGKGNFTKGPTLPMILAQNGGVYATIEGSAVLDLNGDNKQDLIIWAIDRSANLGDMSPGHLEVWINNGDSGFINGTKQWLGNFTTVNLGADTRSLSAFLPGTKLIPLNISQPQNGSALDGYIQESIFLYDTGSQLLPIYDPFWNSQYLPDSQFYLPGTNANGLSWGSEGGKAVSIYKNFLGELVKVTLDPVNEQSYVVAHNPFTIIDRQTKQVTIDDGYAFTWTTATQGSSQANTTFMKTMVRELVMNQPGSKILIGSSINDYISVGNAYAGTGNNILIGGGGDDVLMGGSGNDIFYPSTQGKTLINGRAGIDSIVLGGAYSSYQIKNLGSSQYELTGNNQIVNFSNIANIQFSDKTLSLATGTFTTNLISGIVSYSGVANQDSANSFYVGSGAINQLKFTAKLNEFVPQLSQTYATAGSNTLINIQRLQFTDTNLALDIGKDQTAGSGYMLYKAAFNRTPDTGGLGYWISRMDGGMSYSDVAKNFVTSTEFKTAFGGSNPSVNTLVTKLYNNVLNRTPDAGGLTFWQDKLNTGWSTADVLGFFSTSNENVTNVTPLIANGIQYQQFVG